MYSPLANEITQPVTKDKYFNYLKQVMEYTQPPRRPQKSSKVRQDRERAKEQQRIQEYINEYEKNDRSQQLQEEAQKLQQAQLEQRHAKERGQQRIKAADKAAQLDGFSYEFNKPGASLPSYYVKTLILDSNFRDKTTYPSINDFVVQLSEPIRAVQAIRLLRTEFYQPTNRVGYFVLNDIKIPLQVNAIEHAYLYLNGYSKAFVGNNTNTPTVLGRIGPGTEIYPSITANITEDPFAYVMQPVDPKLKRFHVKLLDYTGQQYIVQEARVILTIALYCLSP